MRALIGGFLIALVVACSPAAPPAEQAAEPEQATTTVLPSSNPWNPEGVDLALQADIDAATDAEARVALLTLQQYGTAEQKLEYVSATSAYRLPADVQSRLTTERRFCGPICSRIVICDGPNNGRPCRIERDCDPTPCE